MKNYKDKQKLKQLYDKYNSQKDVAEVCDCSAVTIKNWMEKFGIEPTDTHSNVRDRESTPVEHEPNTTCDFCGSDFWRKPSLKGGRNFCDKNCQGSWKSENISGEDHHQYERIEVTCNNCGDSLKVVPSHHEKVDNHYCDHNCQTEYEDRSGSNNPSWKGGKEVVECHYCGSELKVYQYRYKNEDRFFCGYSCRGDWATEKFSGENHPLWSGYSENYGAGWLAMRKKARKRDNGTCQICGKSKEELGKWPDVHHIQPVTSFEDKNNAHFLDNLILLCSSCHGKVEQGELKTTPTKTQQ